MAKNYKVFFIIFLLLATTLRLFGLDQPIFDDETNYVQSVNDPGPAYTIKPFQIHQHPPLGGWIFMAVGKLIGQSEKIYRSVPLFFWLLNSILLFVIVRREYSEKAAFFSSLLFGFSYYSFLSSLQIDIEGSLLVTTFLLMTLGYLRYIEQKEEQKEGQNKRKYLFFAGTAFGLALLTKINALFIFLVLAFHYLFFGNKITWNRTYLKKALSDLLWILLPAIIIFSLFPLLTPDLFQQMFSHSSGYFGLTFSVMALGMLMFWATPLLLGLAGLQLWQKEKKDAFWSIWFILIMLIYTLLIAGRSGTHGGIGGVADYARHLMNLLVPLSVLGGVYLTRLRLTRKEWKQFFTATIGTLFLFFLINLQTPVILARDFTIYMHAIKQLKWNFLFSFTTSSGNLLVVNMGILLATCLVLALCFALILYAKKRSHPLHQKCILAFLAIGLALNLFLAAEYFGPITSPDGNAAFDGLVSYAQEHNLTRNIYVNDEGLLLAMNNFQFEKADRQYNLGKYFEDLPTTAVDGTLFILNFPPLKEDNFVWQFILDCQKKHEIYSGPHRMAAVYDCSR